MRYEQPLVQAAAEEAKDRKPVPCRKRTDGKNRAENGDQMNRGERSEVHDNLEESRLQSLAREKVEYCRQRFPGGVIWLLQGDLGAGKTTFVRYAGTALGIQDTVNSPTFNLHNHYSGSLGDLHHFDLYRLNEDSMAELEFAEIWESPPDRFTIFAIEWPERLSVYFSRNPYVHIRMVMAEEDRRNLQWEEYGPGELAL